MDPVGLEEAARGEERHEPDGEERREELVLEGVREADLGVLR